MNVARIAVLVIALGAGGGAAYLAMNMINQEQEPEPQQVAVVTPQVVEAEQVLVAREDIPIGTALEAPLLVWRSWPAVGVTDAYIVRSQDPEAITELNGTIARSSFLAGEPVTREKLARTDGGLLSAILPAGMRAVATSISAETSAGGFILPNDRVDVVMARQLDDDGRYTTETILTNVRVLAIDQQVEDRDGERVVVGNTATLELTPQQVQILSVAQQMDARLTLSLRSIEDADEPVDPAADAVHLIGGPGDEGNGAGVTVVRNGVAQQVNPGQ